MNDAWTLAGRRGEARVPVRGCLTVNNLEAVRLAALSGMGLALLPRGHCAADLEAETLTRVLPHLSRPESGLWVVYRRTRHLSAKVRAFADHLVAAVRDEA